MTCGFFLRKRVCSDTIVFIKIHSAQVQEGGVFMKKRILALFMTFCMVLPLMGTGTVWAADVKMPEMNRVIYTSSWGSVTTTVLNDKNELWIYSADQYYDGNGNSIYTNDAKSARCLLTGVKAISGADRVLFALKQDGTVVCYEVYDKKATLQGTLLTGIAELSYYDTSRTIALDKNGNLHYIDAVNGPDISKMKKTVIDSGVSTIFDNGSYLKDGVIWEYNPHTQSSTVVYKGKLPSGIKYFWENKNESYFILTENGDLWGWGNNQTGQLGNGGKYNGQDPYIYVGSYKAEYTTVKIRNSVPEKILGKVEQVWFDGRQVFAKQKDGTLYTWGDGEPIKALVDGTGGKLNIGEWDYPKGWPDAKGWTPRKTTASQWKAEIGSREGIFKADGTLWIDFAGLGKTFVYAGVWSSNVPQPIFSDVPVGAYYDDPVRWAVKEGVTSGTSGTTFSPDQTCTQAQILTFLWRAAGKPAAAGENPFSHKDMTAGQYFYNAMLWAWKEGLIDNGDIDPNAPCKRSDIVSYLWKLEGSPKASAGSSFADVPQSADFASAVQWAVKQGITSGTSATTFGPYDTCTRGQIVTFLYRSFAD